MRESNVELRMYTVNRFVAFVVVTLFAVSLLGGSVLALERNTHRVSVGGTSGAPVEGNNDSGEPSVSSDGRFVAFVSSADNLVAGDTNGEADIFVMDRDTHTVTRVSVGGTSGAPVQSNSGSDDPSISADGRYVAFSSHADNLVADDTNAREDVFVMDRDTHTVTRVSVGGTSGAPVQASSWSDDPSISADGRYVAFVSRASNLVADDTNGYTDIYVMDRDTHTVTRVSVGGTSGSPIESDSGSENPAISADGRYVAFITDASTLIAGDTNDATDVYVMDRDTHTVTRVSEGGTSGAPIESNEESNRTSISADGRYVAFESAADNLVPGDMNDSSDIFVMDRDTHTLTRVSMGGTSGSPIEGNSESRGPAISADGRYVAFLSYSDNLVPGDIGTQDDIFVIDRDTHTLSRISMSGTSESPVESNGHSYGASISADGRFVAYVTSASNLISDDTNGYEDIYVSSNILAAPSDDGDNVPEEVESAAPNGGDANNDGTPDSEQPEVTSILSPVSSQYVTLESTCNDNFNVQIGSESSATPDANYTYPAGLVGFVLRGCSVGGTATITKYYYGTYDLSKLTLRKLQNGVYLTVPGAVFTNVTIGGQPAVQVVYQITDGSSLDDDGIADGNIVDPAGIATAVLGTTTTVGAPNTGYERQGLGLSGAMTVIAMVLIVSGLLYRKSSLKS